MNTEDQLVAPNAEDPAAGSEPFSEPSLLETWPTLDLAARLETFAQLPRLDAEELFITLGHAHQAEVLEPKSNAERRSWLRSSEPDDLADLIQEFPHEQHGELLLALDGPSRKEVSALLAYAEDNAGGLMNSRFSRLRPEMDVDAAMKYLRMQATQNTETVYYAYVLDKEQVLLGVVSYRELFMGSPTKTVQEIMTTELVKVHLEMDQEHISRLFSQSDLMAIPVVDADNKMQGIVTVDDIVDVVQEEATEDMQKVAGMEALDAPYFDVGFWQMIKKRAGWLVILFLGETFTATAMNHFQAEIARAVVLTLFIPLIVSSGGNTGSQASTLIIRAMALGEVTLADWWRVFFREIMSGLTLGIILGSIGLLRVILWPAKDAVYSQNSIMISLTVGASLVGVTIWGTLMGSMLPFALRKLGWDPASASAPLVATLVDVTGLVIYFSVATAMLTGTLL